MRRAALSSLLLALALASCLAPAAARRLAGAELVAGGKPWQSKPVQTTKPLIGILAQVGGRSRCAQARQGGGGCWEAAGESWCKDHMAACEGHPRWAHMLT